MPVPESFRAFRENPVNASFWPRSAGRAAPRSRLSVMWDGITARERAFWLTLIGGADAVKRGEHEGPWEKLAQSTQTAIVEAMARTAQRARLLMAGTDAPAN